MEDDSEDAEEKSRRIMAEQEAKNIGVVVGMAAGVAMEVADRIREADEQGQTGREEQQAWRQKMGGL